MQIKQIISGGQTGADRAALDAAQAHNFPHGGFCPKGREAEDGVISEVYKLTEVEGGYRQRTKANLVEAAGTVIFYDRYPTGGTELTLYLAIKHKRPYLLIDISVHSIDSAVAAIALFVSDIEGSTLNVAGPRASLCPEIYSYVRHVIEKLLYT